MALYSYRESPQALTPHNTYHWSLSARIFHWVSVLLLLLTWLMIVLDENFNGDFISTHKALGLSMMCWTMARLINRGFSHVPKPLPMPRWHTLLAHFTHAMLYVLLLAMPLAGWFATMYRGYDVSFFGLFDIPTLVSTNRDLARTLLGWHKDILWPALLAFTGLHILGALYHQWIRKDNLVKRMIK